MNKTDLNQISDVINQAIEPVKQKLTEHDLRFDAIDERLSQHDRQFAKIDQKFDDIGDRFEEVNEKLDKLTQTQQVHTQAFRKLERHLRIPLILEPEA